MKFKTALMGLAALTVEERAALVAVVGWALGDETMEWPPATRSALAKLRGSAS